MSARTELFKKSELFDENDLLETYFRAGGKGGQHRNKVETAVRLEHVLSGIVVECSKERKRGRNRVEARRMLDDKLRVYYGVDEPDKRVVNNVVVRTYHEPNDTVRDEGTGRRWSWKETLGKGDLSVPIEDRFRELAINPGMKKGIPTGRVSGAD